MKPPLPLLALCLSGCVLSGCATTGGGPNQLTAGQRILDKYLSPGFTGDVDIRETIPLYLSITLEGKNLSRDLEGWRYDWIEYNRNGPVGTSAHIRLGKRP